jgi:hypothetical protein
LILKHTKYYIIIGHHLATYGDSNLSHLLLEVMKLAPGDKKTKCILWHTFSGLHVFSCANQITHNPLGAKIATK